MSYTIKHLTDPQFSIELPDGSTEIVSLCTLLNIQLDMARHLLHTGEFHELKGCKVTDLEYDVSAMLSFDGKMDWPKLPSTQKANNLAIDLYVTHNQIRDKRENEVNLG